MNLFEFVMSNCPKYLHFISILEDLTYLDNTAAPQPRRYKPAQRGDDFLTKFQRNAGLVANGVARNLNKVGAYIKDTMDDIMYPYRKRPK
jgi:hypothetical protein